ncbi:nitrile hydratase subunit beta [Cognatishimia sp. 1_MG-2023]|uniref:nitrile hydratase subunit beta n=1 Tax=Cognatishimia sp. 1_MG-2023 TaxID=3062642 RepID=UPI0026E2653A|nr:nitrile hydratase subunit beta [Cognatishimia sp. 1_MG-2023]MDO6726466.1 nitrile hydratase subunit beta [Cognatishimia sp. 1_MG-2023]
MSRVHDMGGRFGDGPVRAEDDSVFAQEWHKTALALNLAVGALGQWNIDKSRHARECLVPKDYARFSYYEKWMAGLADLMVAEGVVTADELAGGAIEPSELAERCLKADKVAAALASGGPADRVSEIDQVFAIGDLVQARKPARNQMVEGGHTRLPSYAAGAVGRVVLYHGTHVFPDANAHGLGERPEPLYAVAFSAAALWGTAESAGDEVIMDLWQSYLVPV